MHWTVHLEGGPRRVNHAAVVANEKIYSFGGYCTGEDYENTRPMDVHILNPECFRWTAIPVPDPKDPHAKDIPYQRYGHTAVADEDIAYIWGGRNDRDGACDILFAFDTIVNKWSRPKVKGELPGARDGHSACIINHCMYIFGGYEQQVDKFSNQVHSLNLKTMMWSLLNVRGSPARWRDFHSASPIGDYMYIFGGRSDHSGPYHTNHELYCNRMRVFDTKTYTWLEPEVTGSSPAGRRSHSAFVYQDEVYVFGGFNGLKNEHLADLHKFNPETNQWSLLKVRGQGPCPRRRQCCCVLNNKVFLFGGTCPCHNKQAGDAEVDLIDHSDLHVLDYSPSLKTLSMMTVIKHGLKLEFLPLDLRSEIMAMTTNSNISRPMNTSG